MATRSREDVVPGDVGSIRHLARSLADAAQSAREARSELTGIGSSFATVPWEGLTATAFRVSFAALPLGVEQLAAGYDDAATVLRGYADSVEDLQTQADRALDRARRAADRIRDLRGQAAEAQREMTSAQSRLSSASQDEATAGADPTPAGLAAQQLAAAARRAAADAVDGVAARQREIARLLHAAEQELHAAEHELDRVHDAFRSAVRTCTRHLEDAGHVHAEALEWRHAMHALAGGAVTLFHVGKDGKKTWGVYGKTKLYMTWLLNTMRASRMMREVEATGEGVEALFSAQTGAAAALREFLVGKGELPAVAAKLLGKLPKGEGLVGLGTRATSLLGKASMPLTAVFGAKDLMFGAGHKGAHDVADRVAGGVGMLGGGALTAAMLGVSLGPVGVGIAGAAVVGYGLYQVGNIIYDNRKAIGHALSAAGHAYVAGVKAEARAVAAAGRLAVHGAETAGRVVVHAGHEAVEVASAGVHAATEVASAGVHAAADAGRSAVHALTHPLSVVHAIHVF